MKQNRTHHLKLATVGACLGVAVTGLAPLQAETTAPAQDGKLDKVERENQELRKRLEVLESLAQKEGLLAKSDAAAGTVLKAATESIFSGFVTASYFHDTSHPPTGISPGYLWNRKNDSISLNKVKLTVASPAVAASGDKWDVGYRASLILGQDAPVVNSSAATLGFQNLREAYVEMNIPIGTGLNVKAGELISLLNYESGDGGAANDNFSQGYQWFFTGNGPSGGVQLGYALTDWLDVKVRVENGLYAGPVDNNRSKSVMVAFGIKPMDKVWLSLIGHDGYENNLGLAHLSGGSLLAGWQATDKLHFGTELDYENVRGGAVQPHTDSSVWSTGLWVSYALTEKLTPALRAEFLSDHDGKVAVPAYDLPGGFAANTGQSLSSLAFTLNYKPAPNIKIQPEVRYDHSSFKTAFGTKQDRVIFGSGISYLF
ncbi:MAG: hypothetical protein EB141_00570 [Verrucomicrobia bacterium]|nr:hypothetical protein [Verrucomicrobiota bacterium]NBU10462.1 hypothetical protein [Pseudomonadota bacterium]NDA65228.1 hypothetical protein [Verrucomicrobiota bacterium]NDB74137.1 hypothetical protein [Verrucomicrobiota bacterium]NDD36902.1 hypothetical protein [Verrucomicrobiota bacterium]